MTIKRLKRINREFLKPIYHTLPENLLPTQKIDKKTRKILAVNYKTLKKNKTTLEKTIKIAQNKIIKNSLIPLFYQKQINTKFPFLFTSKGEDFNCVDYTKEWQNQKAVSILKFILKGESALKKDLQSFGSLENASLLGIEKFHFLYSLDQLQHQLKPSLKYNSSREMSPFLYKLRERKKVSILYGNLSVKDIKKAVNMVTGDVQQSSKGRIDEKSFLILESRLDVAICRICFFKTILSARQWIYHGKIKVNNVIVTFPGYFLQPGDVISVISNSIEKLKTEIKKNINLVGRFTLKGVTMEPKKKIERKSNKLNLPIKMDWYKPSDTLKQESFNEFQNQAQPKTTLEGDNNDHTDSFGLFHQKKKIKKIESFLFSLAETFLGQTKSGPPIAPFKMNCTKQSSKQEISYPNLDKQKQSKGKNLLQEISCSMILKSREFLVEQLRLSEGFIFKGSKQDFQKSAIHFNRVKMNKGIQKLDYLYSLYYKDTCYDIRSPFGPQEFESFCRKEKTERIGQEFISKGAGRKKKSISTTNFSNNFLLFLQLKEILLQAFLGNSFLFPIAKKKGIRKKITPLGAVKPINLEVSYRLLTAIYLYPPQKIGLPALLDIESVKRSFM